MRSLSQLRRPCAQYIDSRCLIGFCLGLTFTALLLLPLQRLSGSPSFNRLRSIPGRPSSFAAEAVPEPFRRLWGQLDSCGAAWQEEYAQLQRDVLAGRHPERIVVSVATKAGE